MKAFEVTLHILTVRGSGVLFDVANEHGCETDAGHYHGHWRVGCKPQLATWADVGPGWIRSMIDRPQKIPTAIGT